jgi:hypothetical protein
MRKVTIIFVSVLICCCTKGQAQKQAFYLLPQVGLVNGDDHVSGSVLLSGGFANKNWQYGAGTGYDYYKFRSVPVYAEVKRLFGANSNKIFIYTNAGWNIAFPLESQRYHYSNWWWETTSKSKFSNGIIAEGGAGVFLPNKKGKGFVLSLGYSTKTLKESWTEMIWDPVASLQISTPRSNKYTLNRTVLKVGFRIF